MTVVVTMPIIYATALKITKINQNRQTELYVIETSKYV